MFLRSQNEDILAGPKTPPQVASSSSTPATGPSDLLAALSLSYGGGPPKKTEKCSDEKKAQVVYEKVASVHAIKMKLLMQKTSNKCLLPGSSLSFF